MAYLILNAKFHGRRRSIAASDDGCSAGTGGLCHGISQRLTALGELLELKHAHRTVPHDGPGASHGLGEQFPRFGPAIQALKVVRYSVFVRRVAHSGVVAERVSRLKVDW